MTELSREVKRARGVTKAFGIFAIVLSALFLALGAAGGDGSTSGATWIVQGVVLLAFGSVQVYFARQIGSDRQQSLHSLKVLSYLMIAALILGVVSMLGGDFSVVLSMLISLLMLSYYRAAKKSLIAPHSA